MSQQRVMMTEGEDVPSRDVRSGMSELLGFSSGEGDTSLRPTGQVTIDGDRYDAGYVSSVLSDFLTDERRERIETVLAHRTTSVATVVEGIANLGNVSAVMRTAEAFGFHQFHVIGSDAIYKQSSRTTQGAHKWLDVYQWSSADEAVAALKRAGYRVLATSLSDDAESFEQVDFAQPIALVFGNERDGISDRMGQLADGLVRVETPGFVESFNISVAAAVCLYHAYRAGKEAGVPVITGLELAETRAKYYARSVKDAAAILRRSTSG